MTSRKDYAALNRKILAFAYAMPEHGKRVYGQSTDREIRLALFKIALGDRVSDSEYNDAMGYYYNQTGGR
jgi:hypothetical protein